MTPDGSFCLPFPLSDLDSVKEGKQCQTLRDLITSKADTTEIM